MQAAFGQRALLVCLAALFSVTAGGCAIGGKSFSIDSNSRVPFFGLEFKERKPKSTAPSYNSISRTDADRSRIETVVRSDSSAPRPFLKNGDKNIISARVSGAVDAPTRLTMGETPSMRSQPVLSVPLPVTNVPPATMDRRMAGTAIDFQ